MKIFAHRGYSECYPENTMLAFSKALEIGVDGIETDVRLSADNKAVLFHDDDFMRLLGIKGCVEDFTYEQMQKYHLDSHQKIPLLEELLKLVHESATIVLEIKYNANTYKKLCEIVCEMIADKTQWVEVSCFDDIVLESVHAINKEIKLHKLVEDCALLQDLNLEKKYEYASCFDVDIALMQAVLDSNLMKRRKVVFWTVDKENITKAQQNGLFGVMTNDPSHFLPL